MSEEDDLISEADQLEQEAQKGRVREVEQKAQILATRILAHIETKRDDPVAQREALVRLAKTRSVSRLLEGSGLIGIQEDKNLGRVVIQLRADDDLVDRMKRANSTEILQSPDAPFLRVFRQK